MNKKLIGVIVAIVAIVLIVVALSLTMPKKEGESDKTKVVVTSFSAYDFVRQIAGDKVELTFLLRTRKRCPQL